MWFLSLSARWIGVVKFPRGGEVPSGAHTTVRLLCEYHPQQSEIHGTSVLPALPRRVSGPLAQAAEAAYAA